MKNIELDEDLLEFLNSSPLSENDLNVRVKNGCRRLGIGCMFDMLKRYTKKDREFLDIFGGRSLAEIREYFKQRSINTEDSKLCSKIEQFYNENCILWKITKNFQVSLN